MSQIFDWLFGIYDGTPTHLIVLEFIAVFFGLLSVIFSKRENILVYPTGMISTGIFVYILLVYGLLGDMLINGYYFAMSIYGWIIWTRHVDDAHYTPITKMNHQEKIWSFWLFISTILFVSFIYFIFEKWGSLTAVVDTFTTAIFFVGMWLMAKKKIENWIFWIVGDIISVPLYLYKGLSFSSMQYLIFTFIAISGYFAWQKKLNRAPRTLLQ